MRAAIAATMANAFSRIGPTPHDMSLSASPCRHHCFLGTDSDIHLSHVIARLSEIAAFSFYVSIIPSPPQVTPPPPAVFAIILFFSSFQRPFFHVVLCSTCSLLLMGLQIVKVDLIASIVICTMPSMSLFRATKTGNYERWLMHWRSIGGD